jgi:MFS family permease
MSALTRRLGGGPGPPFERPRAYGLGRQSRRSLPLSGARLGRARRAVGAIFFVDGVVLATWLAHIPAAKARLGLGDGELGLVLLSMAAGSMLALPVAGWLIARWGSRSMTGAAALAFFVALPLPALGPSVALVTLALAAFGAGNALLDVSMNAQAVTIEAGYGRPILSSFHGLWSAGCLAGASLASGAMALGVGPGWHVAGVSALSLLGLAAVFPHLVPVPPARGPGRPAFVRPPATLLGLGLLTFCGLLAEGAIGDWSAVYLHDALGATPAVAPLGFATFSLTMAAGRLGGDHFARWLGPRVLLRASATVAATGLGISLLLGRPWVALVGFGLVGLGIANVIPVLFSAAGRVRGVAPGAALAIVATTGYAGYLAGPPIIGLAAATTNLTLALGIVSVACALIGAGARALPGHVPDAAADRA